jgi:SAM-dependent methyltransferase
VWNYPTSVATELLPDIAPQLLHYHRELTPHLKLKKVGRRKVDNQIDKLNSAIEQCISKSLLNSVYWDFRYSRHPELGSGVGSRGDALSNKIALLEQALRGLPFENASVVDVGCGDLELTRHLPFTNYLGIDVSRTSLSLARSKRPDWKFELLLPGAGVPAADMVLCIDVLIHQKTEAAFRSLIDSLARATGRRLVVSGYEAPPRFASEITAYHFPITEALKNTGQFIDIRVIGEHRETVMIIADKGTPENLAADAVNTSPYYDIERISEQVAAGDHRAVVGDAWEEIGQLQFEFLKNRGLRPCHRLLDIGCGALRGGVHFIRYLDQGNYVGVDINQSVLDAGYNVELRMLNLQSRMPRENLVCVGDFNFSCLPHRQFDFALAQSLFTHLTLNQIRECLCRLAEAVKIDGIFFATFFELPRAISAAGPYLHSPGGITTYGAADPYHYWLADMFYAAQKLPWQVRYIGDWGHPRAQRMISFRRTAE